MSLKSVRVEAHGELGDGKSLIILWEALRWSRTHPKLTWYSNMPLNFPHIKIDDPEVIFQIKENSIVILDELWHLANSRRAMSLINDIMTMLLIRSRKKHWFVGYTQQHWKQTDNRIRFITEVWIEPRMQGKYLLANYFDKEGTWRGDRVIDGSKIWDLYDSEADPYSLDVEGLERAWKRHKEELGN